jgi:N-acetylmuramoyl-L-alanine amidase
MLEHSGISAKLTRETEAYPSLGKRCEIANEWEADYFVSIHCNSNGPDAVGIEVLYKTETGKALAEPIHEALIRATGDRDRGLKHRTGLHVLNATRMPACLPEIGFISHPETEKKLALWSYNELIARAIHDGILKFLDWKQPEPLK